MDEVNTLDILMNNDSLTDDNFILFCAKYYCMGQYTTTEDFEEDMSRIKYIRKLITRYVENGDLRERLILNHIIVLSNCFAPDILCKILYLKLKDYMKYVKPFLVLISVLPDTIYNVDNEFEIDTNIIPMDQTIVSKLRII